jgi:hypothetical protein
LITYLENDDLVSASTPMALRLGQDGTVVTVSLPDCAAHRTPEDFAIISRHKDRLLRSVTFARRKPMADAA